MLLEDVPLDDALLDVAPLLPALDDELELALLALLEELAAALAPADPVPDAAAVDDRVEPTLTAGQREAAKLGVTQTPV